jgi:putative transposase
MKPSTPRAANYFSAKSRAKMMSAIPPQYGDFSKWPQVEESSVPAEKRKRFKGLVKAAEMLLNAQPMKHVLAAAGVGERRFWRLISSALTMRLDAPTINGTGAFVWGRVQKPRVRKAAESPHRGREGFGGLFEKFTREHPSVLEDLIKFLNGKERPNNVTPRMLHVKFKELVIQAGVRTDQYPRNAQSYAYKPLMQWYESVYQPQYLMTHLRQEHGDAAATAAGYERGDGQSRTPALPYTVWVIDECRVNVDAALQVPMAIWDLEYVFLPQFPILRCRSIVPVPCNISWHMCLRVQASGDDVIELFKRAVMGQPAVNLIDPDMKYEPGAGYPQNVFPKLRFAVPLLVYLDNALSHLYDALQHLVQRLYGGRVILGVPKTPKARPDIESSFAALYAGLLHQLPNTSGTGPLDPVRKKSATTPDRAVPVGLLEQAVDVYFANQNVLPSAGAGHLGAFTRLERLLETGQVKCNYLPEAKRAPYRFCKPKPVTILCNLKEGRLPHINYDYRRYSSQWLKTQPKLEGKKLWAYADYGDLRTVVLEEDDGSTFATVTCEGMWGRVPHDRRMLAIFAKHKSDAQFLPRPQDGPLFAVLKHLEKRSPDDRDAALDYGYVMRYLKQHAVAEAYESSAAVAKVVPAAEATNVVPLASAASSNSRPPTLQSSFNVPRRLA